MTECTVCGKEREGGTTYVLTEGEKRAIGEGAANDVYYCQPCHRIMQDPEAGAKLLRGVYMQSLLQSGVAGPRAEALATKYYETLVKR